MSCDGTLKLVAAIVRGTPSMPRAACRGRHELFDDVPGRQSRDQWRERFEAGLGGAVDGPLRAGMAGDRARLEMASFLDSAQARNKTLGACDSQAHDSAVAEVGLMLAVSARTAACRVGEAWSLCTRGRQAIEPRLPPQVHPEGWLLDLPGDVSRVHRLRDQSHGR